MTGAAFRKLALAFPGTEARPHFERTAFRTTRKTFATLSADGKEVNVMLDADAQDAFCNLHPTWAHPVAGGWGRMGWTTLLLPKATPGEVKKLLADAYALALPAPARPRPKRR
jgi:predicted DNA-binding protein (MmcQ/YjbR family)